MMFGEEFKDTFDYDCLIKDQNHHLKNFLVFTIIRKVFRDFVKTVL